jgi:uncharacterized protein (TIGR00730 family)
LAISSCVWESRPCRAITRDSVDFHQCDRRHQRSRYGPAFWSARARAYRQAEQCLGEILAERGVGVVFGGGGVGLMGAVADAALSKRGEVIGVIPESLVRREIGHRGVTKLHVVETMHQRKALMADLSDAFIALPGGYGTLEEFCEAVTWSQLGIQQKPWGVLNIERYWDGLLAVLDHAVDEKFVRPENSQLVLVAQTPEWMLERLSDWTPPAHIEKWLDKTQR